MGVTRHDYHDSRSREDFRNYGGAISGHSGAMLQPSLNNLGGIGGGASGAIIMVVGAVSILGAI